MPIEILEPRKLLSAVLSPIASFSNAPLSPVIADSAGNLYGTTNAGGPSGDGTVFRVSAANHTNWTLATFNGTDGSHPSGGLVADSSGNLYGTTQTGGTFGDGVLFKLSAGSNKLSVLVSFNGTNGQYPNGGLIFDHQGNLYGTTELGGANSAGVVFMLNPKTDRFTLLTSLGGSLGDTSTSGLVIDANGNLFGTTAVGAAGGVGTVFEIAAGSHQASTITTFDTSPLDLAYFTYEGAKSSLVIDAWGDLFGSVVGSASVFEVAAGTHAVTELTTFSQPGEPFPSVTGLTIDASGNLFGASTHGGILFKIVPATDQVTKLISLPGSLQFASTPISDAAGNLYAPATDLKTDKSILYKITGSTFNSHRDFSTDGPYTVNAKNQLLTAAGQLAQGFTANSAGIIQGSTAGAITIPLGQTLSRATTTATLVGNLNATPGTTFNTLTFMTIYNAVGAPVDLFLSIQLSKRSSTATSWMFSVSLDDNTALCTGTLHFNAKGRLISTTGTELTLPRSGKIPPIKMQLDFSAVTAIQNTQGSLIDLSNQDGLPPGTLNMFHVSPNGIITGSYTNGATKTLGQIINLG